MSISWKIRIFGSGHQSYFVVISRFLDFFTENFANLHLRLYIFIGNIQSIRAHARLSCYITLPSHY
jgi:hypothetical protein